MTPSLLLGSLLLTLSADADPTRVLPPGEKPADGRLVRLRTLNDTDFDMIVPPSREAWEASRQAIREQILVSNGLWPMPERTPLQPVIHGKIDRDDYTIEKVYFASLPGHYVTGNLYRPKGKSGKLPAVLNPHGHWPNGRFFDAERDVENQIKQGAEKTPESARYPLQAKCAGLARLGCVVFLYDMVGYADSRAIEHRKGFVTAEDELRLLNDMGLQTWNTIRAFDFLAGLPDVDPKRIGVTGASGGGTQTFIFCAIDDRPIASVPAVMVSTQMQGGCFCENASYLRQGMGNVDFAAAFAPRPQALIGADDWTIHIESKGLPELKAVYQLYGAADKIHAKCFPQFKHNYNQVSRELMYNWFNKHLGLGLPEPVAERPFVPVPPKELAVYDAEHPMPKDFASLERLRQILAERSDAQIASLLPKDDATLQQFRKVIGTALRVMIGSELPAADQVEARPVGSKATVDGATVIRATLHRKGEKTAVPAVVVSGPEHDGTCVVWVHPEGKASLFRDGKLVPEARKLLDGKAMIVALDPFGVGELKPEKPFPVDPRFAGFTFGYNRPLLANRVYDILTAVGFARGHANVKRVHLVGFDRAGPWTLLARALCGDAVARTAADWDQFRFEQVRETSDERMLPGAVKYGGLSAFAALAAPGELYVHNHRGTGSSRWLRPAYEAAKAGGRLTKVEDKATAVQAIDWLLR